MEQNSKSEKIENVSVFKDEEKKTDPVQKDNKKLETIEGSKMNIQKRTVTSASRPPKPPANSAKPRPKTSNSFKKVDEKSLETMVNEYGDGMLKMNREKEKKKRRGYSKSRSRL